MGHFCPPESGSGYGSRDPIESGSGSTGLPKRQIEQCCQLQKKGAFAAVPDTPMEGVGGVLIAAFSDALSRPKATRVDWMGGKEREEERREREGSTRCRSSRSRDSSSEMALLNRVNQNQNLSASSSAYSTIQ